MAEEFLRAERMKIFEETEQGKVPRKFMNEKKSMLKIDRKENCFVFSFSMERVFESKFLCSNRIEKRGS